MAALGAAERAECSGGTERCQNPFDSLGFWHDPSARVNNNNDNNDGVPGPENNNNNNNKKCRWRRFKISLCSENQFPEN